MRRFRFWPQMALVVAFAVMNAGCVLIPEIKDRVVELAVAGTTSKVFTVQSATTILNETYDTIDLSTDLDLGQVLADAGIDVSQVTHIALAGIQYRITRADADHPDQSITGGTITIRRLTLPTPGPETNLVTGFTASPGTTSGFKDVTLDANGVAVVNTLLNDVLAALPNPVENGAVTIHLTGASSAPTDFDFELKVTVSITGTVKVSVPT